MSDALRKAEDAVREAEDNSTDVARIVAAVLATQAAQQQTTPAPCQHQHRTGRSAGEWIGISCAICIGGTGLAFASIAIAIGGLSVAILALVLRSIWRDVQSKR